MLKFLHIQNERYQQFKVGILQQGFQNGDSTPKDVRIVLQQHETFRLTVTYASDLFVSSSLLILCS